jgi:hypothetical protein
MRDPFWPASLSQAISDSHGKNISLCNSYDSKNSAKRFLMLPRQYPKQLSMF